MYEWQEIVNFAIESAGLAIAMIGLFISISGRRDKKADYVFFITIFSILIVYVGAALLSTVSLGILGGEFTSLSKTALFIESLSSSTLMPLLVVFLLQSIGEDFKKSPFFYIASVLWLVYFALLVYTQFSESIYYFTPDNVYHRGDFYSVLLVPPVLIMADALVLLTVKRGKLTKQRRGAFALYITAPLGCMIVQMAFFGILLIVFGTSVSAFLMLLLIFREQMEESVRKAEENARLNASVAVLQMRPHFICNTMTNLRCLCPRMKRPSKKPQKR